MTLESLFTNTIIPLLGENFYLLSLLGSIISGNLFVLFIATLAGQGTLSIFKVWLVALIGTFIADILWYHIGKTNFINRLARHKHTIYNYQPVKDVLTKSEEKNNSLVFLISKFVYGTRILTLMHAGRRRMHLDRFLKYNYTASAIWVTILVFVGFLAGKGFTKLLETLNSVRDTLTIFLLILAILYITWYFLGRIVKTHMKKLNKTVYQKTMPHRIKYHKLKKKFKN